MGKGGYLGPLSPSGMCGNLSPFKEARHMSALKDAIGRAVDGLADELESLSHRIHANPELGYQEVKAAGWLAEFLAAKGFKVEKGVAGGGGAHPGPPPARRGGAHPTP